MTTFSRKNWIALITFVVAIGIVSAAVILLQKPADPEKKLSDAGMEVVVALKNKDGSALALLASPDGVWFSPYTHVDPKKDIHIPVDQLKNIFTDPAVRVWGTHAGSGEDISLTFPEYYNKFIYDQDFANPSATGLDTVLGQGTMINNLKDEYPASKFVEYHFPGFKTEYNGLDWESLRVVFNEKLELIGIVHDQWTP